RGADRAPFARLKRRVTLQTEDAEGFIAGSGHRKAHVFSDDNAVGADLGLERRRQRGLPPILECLTGAGRQRRGVGNDRLPVVRGSTPAPLLRGRGQGGEEPARTPGAPPPAGWRR